MRTPCRDVGRRAALAMALLIPPAPALPACDDPSFACAKHEETCNSIDDDCDGAVDESDTGGPLRQECSNACGQGQEECVGGAWAYCSAPQPMPEETCNGTDDDCDGSTDEGCACEHGTTRQCGTDVGECDFGVERCDHGAWLECQLGYDPAEHYEDCDGLDNDCDGETDEGCTCGDCAGQECGDNGCGRSCGICSSGYYCHDQDHTCLAGDPMCNDSCRWPADGDCDDGGRGCDYKLCSFGSDCTDCGPRTEADRIDPAADCPGS
jgi:hypothetical protein